MSVDDDLLEVESVKMHFPITRGVVFQKEVASVKAVDGVSFTVKRGETLGIVGESGCGKSTLARCILRLLEPTGGSIRLEGRDITHLSRKAMRPLAARDDDGVPGPVCLAERSQASRLHGRRAARGQQHRHAGGAEAARPEPARGGRPQPRALQPLSSRVLGRPAPAHRDRASSRGQPEADRLRRAGVGTRRLGAGADPQPAEGPPEGVRAHVRLHRARPERRPPHLGPRAGHVPRQGRRARVGHGSLPASTPPILGSPPLGGADSEPGARAEAEVDRARGRRAEPGQPAEWVSFPSALPTLPRGHVRCGGAAASELRRNARRRLPLPARALADDRATRSGAGATAALAEA